MDNYLKLEALPMDSREVGVGVERLAEIICMFKLDLECLLVFGVSHGRCCCDGASFVILMVCGEMIGGCPFFAVFLVNSVSAIVCSNGSIVSFSIESNVALSLAVEAIFESFALSKG
jgi:hypothetical protein